MVHAKFSLFFFLIFWRFWLAMFHVVFKQSTPKWASKITDGSIHIAPTFPAIGGFSRPHWDNGGEYFKANNTLFSDCNKESWDFDFLILFSFAELAKEMANQVVLRIWRFSHSCCTHPLPIPSNSRTIVTFSVLPQVSFAKRASMEPELRMAHNLHKMSSLLGGALFIADDAFPETPYLHAAWHLAAALGVGTCNKLLEWSRPSCLSRL